MNPTDSNNAPASPPPLDDAAAAPEVRPNDAANDADAAAAAVAPPDSPQKDEAPPSDSSHGEDAHPPAPPPEDALRAEIEHLQDQRVRLAADFDNYRKRAEERLRASWTRAQADLLARLLDPMDDLGRVAECDPETGNIASVVEGVDLVERKFARILEEIGVEVVDPRGEPFDPSTMEAIMRVSTDAEDQDETVERVVQRGFTLKGHLLRPARVAVYKAG